MYKVLVDTNIIIDFLYIRKPFYEDSKKIIQLIEDKSIKGYITTSILMDLHYIIWHRLASKKERGRAWGSAQQARGREPVTAAQGHLGFCRGGDY